MVFQVEVLVVEALVVEALVVEALVVEALVVEALVVEVLVSHTFFSKGPTLFIIKGNVESRLFKSKLSTKNILRKNK